MRIAIGAPGNGALLKDALAERLAEDGRVSDVFDLSTPEITYPEVSFRVARAVAEGRVDRGLLICGTGVGTAIAANKVPGVRAATAHDLLTVRGSVENYDAQVLCMGQNVIAAPPPGRSSTSGSTCATTPPAATAPRSARSPPTRRASTPDGGSIERTGAQGTIRSLYMRGPERKPIAVAVYEGA